MKGPRYPGPGSHTAHGGILDYRLGKLRQHLTGDWLDLGCADGFYAVGLADRGAANVVGVEALPALIDRANRMPHPPNVTFVHANGESLPFADDSFDGVLLNEVLEHVENESATLCEIARVLKPGGVLALFSPNRWFPFEGHGARLERRVLMRKPVPLMPWLPKTLTRRVATARNYWPRELATLVRAAGLDIATQAWALAQFEQYPWVPKRVADWHRRHLPLIEKSPAVRFFAVSTFIVATAPDRRV